MEPMTLLKEASLHFSKLERKDFQLVQVMLSRAGLPIEDLSEDMLLYGLYEENARLVGTAGLEVFGPVALLRSVLVVPEKRGSGYGKYLLRGVEAYARAQGVLRLYLLTTTAEHFFQHRGFRVAGRESAPLAIRNTFEFSALCPSTAVLMKKDVGG